MLRFVIFWTVRLAVSVFPRWFVYWGSHRLGDINYLFDRRGREAVKSNLRTILPAGTSEDHICFEARWVFRNFAKVISEFFSYRHFGPEFMDRYVQSRGMEHVDNALARGRGAILVSAHIGNWELAAGAMAHLGHTVWGIVQMHAHPKVNELFIGQREKRNYRILDMHNAVRPSAKALKEGGIICVMGERNLTDSGIPVRFFGKTALFPQGPARLALATKSPLLPGFTIRRPNEGFTLCFEPELQPPATGTKKEKVQAMTQEFARILEDYVRWHPSQWGVFYRAWDEDPPGKVASRTEAAPAVAEDDA